MTTFLDDESSTQDGRPREGYDFIMPAVTYRLASADRDITIDGNVYKKSPVQRGEIFVNAAANAQDLEVTLPLAHPIAQRYAKFPPAFLNVAIKRKMLRSGASEPVWFGEVISMAVEKNLAKFVVTSRLGALRVRRLPTITVGRSCAHVLYDANCRALRSSFRITTTITSVDGPFIRVASVGGNPDQWFQYGEVFHPASGERMTVFDQTGTLVTMQFPIIELQAGMSVELFAGCDHGAATCQSKFLNMVNYGGQPQLPTANPFLITGFGIYRSES